MKIKEISYLDPRVDLEDDCLDVFVTLEDNYCTNEFSYLVEVTTPKFFYTLMERFQSDFVPSGYPYIIVSKLTDEIIQAAIQEFIDEKEDSYWLKLYHITATLNIEDINEILDRKEKEEIELEAKFGIRSDTETVSPDSFSFIWWKVSKFEIASLGFSLVLLYIFSMNFDN
jgi:hypothetical protein